MEGLTISPTGCFGFNVPIAGVAINNASRATKLLGALSDFLSRNKPGRFMIPPPQELNTEPKIFIDPMAVPASSLTTPSFQS
jgi:hypothetical protein